MLRRVKDQGRVKNGEPERRKDLNKEQHSRPFRSLGETAFEQLHPALLLSPAVPGDVKPPFRIPPRGLVVCGPVVSDLRPPPRAMSSRACDVHRQ